MAARVAWTAALLFYACVAHRGAESCWLAGHDLVRRYIVACWVFVCGMGCLEVV
jgi:hypothetical protein